MREVLVCRTTLDHRSKEINRASGCRREPRVPVRSSFEGHWSGGFEVAEVLPRHATTIVSYRLRRVSDGRVLPAVFPDRDIIPADR